MAVSLVCRYACMAVVPILYLRSETGGVVASDHRDGQMSVCLQCLLRSSSTFPSTLWPFKNCWWRACVKCELCVFVQLQVSL